MTVALESKGKPLREDLVLLPAPSGLTPTYLLCSPPPGGRPGMSSDSRVLKTVFRHGGSWADKYSSEEEVSGEPILATAPTPPAV